MLAEACGEVAGEIWRPVVGYEGLYEVSNLARVRSLERMAYRKNGTPLHFKAAMKKIQLNSAGYFWTRMTKDGKANNELVHVLVARGFVPNPDSLPDVNHMDLDPKNCLPGNLEWVTHRQNICHARDGGRLHGYTNVKRRFKLQPEQVADIRVRISQGLESHEKIASRHGVSRRMVGHIKQNLAWNIDYSNHPKAVQ